MTRRGQTRLSVSHDPVVIGALGGSGSRALTSILQEAGIFMGAWNDPLTNDSLPIRAFLFRWFRHLVRPQQDDRALPPVAYRWLEAALELHLSGVTGDDVPWGWKNPRNMWLIPFYAQRFPALRFIHLVRDPRDMALSTNRFLLRTQGRALLSRSLRRDAKTAQIALWTRGNARTVAVADTLPGDRFLMVRYEDLCQNPHASVKRILTFTRASFTAELVDRVASRIRPSRSIGRWKGTGETALELDAPTRALMEAFGYNP